MHSAGVPCIVMERKPHLEGLRRSVGRLFKLVSQVELTLSARARAIWSRLSLLEPDVSSNHKPTTTNRSSLVHHQEPLATVVSPIRWQSQAMSFPFHEKRIANARSLSPYGPGGNFQPFANWSYSSKYSPGPSSSNEVYLNVRSEN